MAVRAAPKGPSCSRELLVQLKALVGPRFSRDSVQRLGLPLTGRVPPSSDLESAFARRHSFAGMGWSQARQIHVDGQPITAIFELYGGEYAVQFFDRAGERLIGARLRERVDCALRWEC